MVLEVFSSIYDPVICALYPSLSLLIVKLKQQGVVGVISTVVLCVLSETSQNRWLLPAAVMLIQLLANPKPVSDNAGVASDSTRNLSKCVTIQEKKPQNGSKI